MGYKLPGIQINLCTTIRALNLATFFSSLLSTYQTHIAWNKLGVSYMFISHSLYFTWDTLNFKPLTLALWDPVWVVCDCYRPLQFLVQQLLGNWFGPQYCNVFKHSHHFWQCVSSIISHRNPSIPSPPPSSICPLMRHSSSKLPQLLNHSVTKKLFLKGILAPADLLRDSHRLCRSDL